MTMLNKLITKTASRKRAMFKAARALLPKTEKKAFLSPSGWQSVANLSRHINQGIGRGYMPLAAMGGGAVLGGTAAAVTGNDVGMGALKGTALGGGLAAASRYGNPLLQQAVRANRTGLEIGGAARQTAARKIGWGKGTKNPSTERSIRTAGRAEAKSQKRIGEQAEASAENFDAGGSAHAQPEGESIHESTGTTSAPKPAAPKAATKKPESAAAAKHREDFGPDESSGSFGKESSILAKFREKMAAAKKRGK